MPAPAFILHGNAELCESFRICRRITQQAKSSFPWTFHFLHQDQQLGFEALYAWLRTTDDIADGQADSKKESLHEWRRLTLSGIAIGSPILPAFHETVKRFHIPKKYFSDLLDGVESDLSPRLFGSFESLEPYCYRVAGTVGLACCSIWGAQGESIRLPAEAAGTAFQLTNILRDLSVDWRLGRLYLPTDDLANFGIKPGDWLASQSAFRRLVRFEAERAREFYRRSDTLPAQLPLPGRRMFLAMRSVYERLLADIQRQPEAVLSRRVRVNPLRKLEAVIRAVLSV